MRRLFSKCIWFLAIGCSAVAAEIPAEQFEFFEARIRPVLVERCYKCHSADAEKIKGGLLLDSKEGMLKGGESGKPILVPRDAESSLLIEAIRYQNEDLQMPPKKAGGKLSETQIADFVSWIKTGAPDPRVQITKTNISLGAARTHWAFQPVTNPPVPLVKNKQWVRSPIDEFILAKLESKDLQPSPQADKRTLIRRVTFDLTGLPPTFEEVELFIKDKSTNAFEKVVDRLLSSPRYGERWGRHWLDVARYADTKGYVYGNREETKFVQSYAYRDWVVRSLNEDLPYDQFLRLQIAADQIEGADRESLAAMGFLTLGRRFLGVVHDIIDDRIDVVMRGTQALTVGCARCHDHKFDPIPTRDYYSLYGVFAGGTERTVPLASTGQSAKAFLDFEKEMKKRQEKFQIAFDAKREEQNKRLRAQATEYLVAVLNIQKLPTEEFYSFVQADEMNPVVARQWQSYLLRTKNFFHPVWSPWHAYSALTLNEFAAKSGAIISSLTKATQKLNPLVVKAFQENPPVSMIAAAETYGKLLTSLDKKWSDAAGKKTAFSADEEELRQILYASDSPAAVPAGSIVDMEWFFDEPTRVQLSSLCAQMDQWINQSSGAPPHAVILEDRPVQKNPYVFKRGNPASKGDEVPRQFVQVIAGEKRKPFERGSGRMELAEAIASKENPLTARVMVNRIWAHHFGAGIVRTPSDFGMRADAPSHPELLDWLAWNFMENGWSMKKLHRLILLSTVYQQSSDSEGLAAAETVDPENKLLSRMNRQRLDFEELRDSLLSASGLLDLKLGGKAEELFKPPFSKRRSIYGFIDRQFLPSAFRIFDVANPDMHTPQRSETTVPQQALFFMNGPFVVDQAKAFAARMDSQKTNSPERRIGEFYHIAFQREPTGPQTRAALEFLRASEEELRLEEKPKPTDWRYGFGEFDEVAKSLKQFEALPHFMGDAWQGGSKWPDEKLGWAQLTATGGHAGNDLQHAVVRRWVSQIDGVISVASTIRHERSLGDGIRAYLVSSRNGLLGKWVLHNQSADARAERVEVKKGDTLDFIVSIHASLNNNDFIWTPVIRMAGSGAAGDAREWSAAKEFGGPATTQEKPLTAWEKYAQVLLLSNEFLFVD